MEAEPSKTELAAMSTLGKVLDWCEIPGREDDPTTARGSLLVLLGATEQTHPKFIGYVVHGHFDQMLAAWEVGDQQPSAVLVGTSGHVGAHLSHYRRCRLQQS
jgi:hypothetical protein